MAISVENVGIETLPENSCPREDDDTGIKASLAVSNDATLQASKGHTEKGPTIEAASRLSPSLSSPSGTAPWPRPAEKRRRPLHDVDGPHTGLISCKKRRLRRDLITSRLSRPYSMPATHIIHREASASGDKRFMKLAAVARSKKLNAVVVPTPEEYGTRMPTGSSAVGDRPQQGPVVPLNQKASHHMHASSDIVRRAAILNRIRLKVSEELKCSVFGMGSPVVSEKGTVVSNHTSLPRGDDRPLTNVATLAATTTTGSSNWDNATAGEREHNSNPAHPSAGTDILHLGRLSPRLKPLRSPELRASRAQITVPMDDDQVDDDSLSFTGSVSFADDGEEDVYADFSIIFGGGDASCGDEGGNGEGGGGILGTEPYEDCMDDLDGIPWALR